MLIENLISLNLEHMKLLRKDVGLKVHFPVKSKSPLRRKRPATKSVPNLSLRIILMDLLIYTQKLTRKM